MNVHGSNYCTDWVSLCLELQYRRRQTNLQLCLAALEERGYVARSFLLDALWYGLPQSRRRVYIVCLAVGDREIGCSAEDFFNSVENLLGKLYMDAPPAESG